MVEQVQIPHSVVVGKAPLPAEIAVGGLAVNLKDRVLYTKGYDGIVIQLNEVTFDLVIEALGFIPVEGKGIALPAPATDAATVRDLANSMRALLISCGIGS
jgi:hypothetical protein